MKRGRKFWAFTIRKSFSRNFLLIKPSANFAAVLPIQLNHFHVIFYSPSKDFGDSATTLQKFKSNWIISFSLNFLLAKQRFFGDSDAILPIYSSEDFGDFAAILPIQLNRFHVLNFSLNKQRFFGDFAAILLIQLNPFHVISALYE